MFTLPFIDAHFHPLQLAYFRSAVDLKDVDDEKSLINTLEKAGEPVLGYHFVEYEGFSGGDVLTRYFPKTPVIVIRTCLHKLWMNAVAIKRFGDGLSVSDDGSVVEDGVWTVIDRVFSTYQDVKESIVRDMFIYLLSLGIVGGVEMGVSPDDGEFMARIAEDVGFQYFYFVKSQYDPLDCFGKQRCLGLKLFADGSLGARTAAMEEDYSDNSGGKGILNWDDELLYMKMKTWHDAGYDIAVHVIGDRALRQVLGTYRRVLMESPRPHRHRVEHLQIMYPGAVKEIADMGLYASIQPTFSPEIPWAIQRVGKHRMAYGYRWKELIYSTYTLIGTDAPVYGVSPTDVIRGLTNDRYWKDADLEPASVSLGKAVDLYTVGNMRYLGLITDLDMYRVEWDVFPTKVKKVVSCGKVVYES